MIKTIEEQDVEHNVKKFTTLDKEIIELIGGEDANAAEFVALNEYYAKLIDRCVAQPGIYEDRKARCEVGIAILNGTVTIHGG